MIRSLLLSQLTFLLALLSLAAACAAAPDEAAESADAPFFYLGGIQVNEADHQAWFAALKEEKMNTVEVTAYARQGDWDSDNLFWDAESPWVIEEMRGARRAGLHTVFIARVALDHAFPRNAFLWHGMIQPKNEKQLTEWFERYTRFVLGWAQICQQEGVDVFAIGSEMNALASTLKAAELPALEEYYLDDQKQQARREQLKARGKAIDESFPGELEARIEKEKGWAAQVTGGESLAAVNARRALLDHHWRQLIHKVRQVFKGKLTYAANFDQYQQVGFWQDLDMMGINAYFKLRSEILEPNERARLYPLLLEGWRSVLGEIDTFRQAQKIGTMPLIFTEMGYTRRALSTLEPWSDTGFSLVTEKTPPGTPAKQRLIVWREQPDDKEERALAVHALHEVHAALPSPFLRGILYWKLSSHDYHEKVESFMVQVGGPSKDPILPELRRFLR